MSEKKKLTPEMIAKLRENFPDVAIKQHPTKTFLSTIKAMYITERLNEVFGIGRWTLVHEVIERTADYVLIQGEFQSLDYDVIIPKQFGGHNTSGKNTEIADGYKSAITDCLSKVASYMEIGIDVFKGIQTHNKNTSEPTPPQNTPAKPWLNKFNDKDEKIPNDTYIKVVNKAKEKKMTLEGLKKIYSISKKVEDYLKNDLL